MPQQTVHIATAIDEAYLLPLRVMIASLCEHLRPSVRPVLYLLNQTLTDEQLESISSLVETHSIVPTSDALDALPRQRGFVPEASFPLLLSDLLPESVERVLFLDPDLLVLDDIAKIWETDLDNHVIAAVPDQAIPLCSSARGVKDRRRLAVPDTAPYFNAGVMLVDIIRWRLLDVSARVREYTEQCEGRIDFLHQEALNAVLWNDWLPLDERWNLIASLTGRRYTRRGSSAVADPGIVHFAGHFKPWRFNVGGPFGDLYTRYFNRYAEGEFPDGNSFYEKFLSLYDCHLRDYLYPFERALWNNRLI